MVSREGKFEQETINHKLGTFATLSFSKKLYFLLFLGTIYYQLNNLKELIIYDDTINLFI